MRGTTADRGVGMLLVGMAFGALLGVGVCRAVLDVAPHEPAPSEFATPHDELADADSIAMHAYAVSIAWRDLDDGKRRECLNTLFKQARAYAEPRLQEERE